VSPYYPPYGVGGAEDSTFVLARALRARGHDVRVLTLRLGDAAPDTDVPVETVDVGASTAAGKPLRPRTFDAPALQLRVARAVARAARDADIVHCQTLHLLPAAFLGARAARTPIAVTIRDLGGVCPLGVCLLDGPRVPHDCGVRRLETTCVPRFRDLYGGPSRVRHAVAALVRFATARARSLLVRRCNAVYAISADIAELYVAARLTRPASATVLPNAAELPTEATRGPRQYAIYAGKVSHGKGGAQLLDAAAVVHAAHPDFSLVVAGYAEAPWVERLERAPGVEYVGRVPRSRLADLYRGARLAVVPSIWPEALGRAALEASAAGVPVVASRAGGLPEVVIHEETGLLVAPRDVTALADAVARLWTDEAFARTLGEAGRRRISGAFSTDSISARAEILYASLLSPS
jgi:glycosyltransferase involved in cell wall biosynthesis